VSKICAQGSNVILAANDKSSMMNCCSNSGAGQKTSEIFVDASFNEKWCHIRFKLAFADRFIACVTDETKPRYSPSANQRLEACFAPPPLRVLPRFYVIGSNWLLHMAVHLCTVIGRVTGSCGTMVTLSMNT